MVSPIPNSQPENTTWSEIGQSLGNPPISNTVTNLGTGQLQQGQPAVESSSLAGRIREGAPVETEEVIQELSIALDSQDPSKAITQWIQNNHASFCEKIPAFSTEEKLYLSCILQKVIDQSLENESLLELQRLLPANLKAIFTEPDFNAAKRKIDEMQDLDPNEKKSSSCELYALQKNHHTPCFRCFK